PVQTRTRPKQLATRQSRHRRGHKHRTVFRRPWNAFRDPVRDSEQSDGCRPAFAWSPDVVPTAGILSRSLADLCEGHPLALLAGERTLQSPRTRVHANGGTVPFNQVLTFVA